MVKQTLVLASASPRRRELLDKMGISFVPCAVDVDEHLEGDPAEVVMALARRKAYAAYSLHPGETVLGADTLVYCKGETLGKPRDPQDAVRMLLHLSGSINDVYTGVCLIDGKTGKANTQCNRTRVCFTMINTEAAARYVDSGEPMDKAGAYAVQGMGGMFVSAIEGSPSNAIGLPMHLVREMLLAIGWQL